MKRQGVSICATVLILMALTLAPASAQTAVTTSATVPLASPTGIGAARNLQFGTITVTPGSTKTVIVPAAAALQSPSVFAAEFAYGVDGMAGLDFDITVPTQLTSTVGSIPLAISFNGTQYGGHCVTVGSSTCTLTNFNPAAAGTVRICKSYKTNGTCNPTVWTGGSTAHAYVGGVITIPPTQVAATYTGTITAWLVQVY